MKERKNNAAEKRRRTWIPLFGFLPAVLCLWSSFLHGQTPPSSPPSLPPRILWKADGQEMVLVPGGPFPMGGGKHPAEQPRHSVTLPDYYLDGTEITWGHYLLFCQKTGHPFPPPLTVSPDILPLQQNLPVNNVSWMDADAYCRWAGKRLPTEAEWEKACAGVSGQTYPWGNTWNETICVNRINSGDRPAPVRSRPGCKSPYLIFDLAGNVWEWTADWYKNYPGAPVTFDYTGKERVVRGGAFFYSIDLLRCQNRNHLPPDDVSPHGGFRCAVDPTGIFPTKAEPR